MKPQIYKVGSTWVLWVPGVRVYRFTTWESAIRHALDPSSHEPTHVPVCVSSPALREVPSVSYNTV
jgi:hypothetical protein